MGCVARLIAEEILGMQDPKLAGGRGPMAGSPATMGALEDACHEADPAPPHLLHQPPACRLGSECSASHGRLSDGESQLVLDKVAACS